MQSLAYFGRFVPGLNKPTTERLPADILRHLQDHLLVTRDRRSYTVRLGFWSADPAKAALMANTLSQAYLDHQIGQKRQLADGLADQFKQQIAELAVRDSVATLALQNAIAEAGATDKGLPVTIERQIDALSTDLGRVRSRQIQAAATLKVFSAGQTTAVDEANKAAEAEFIRSGTEESLLRAEIATLRTDLAQRTNADTRLADLKRDSETIKVQLDATKTRLNAQLASAERMMPDAEILAAATPPVTATFPNPLLMLAGALLAGGLAGLALAWPALQLLTRQRDERPFVEPMDEGKDVAAVSAERNSVDASSH